MWARKSDLGALATVQQPNLVWNRPRLDPAAGRTKGAKLSFRAERRKRGANKSLKCDEMIVSCRGNTNTGSPDEVVCIEGTWMVEGFGEGPRAVAGKARARQDPTDGGEPENLKRRVVQSSWDGANSLKTVALQEFGIFPSGWERVKEPRQL